METIGKIIRSFRSEKNEVYAVQFFNEMNDFVCSDMAVFSFKDNRVNAVNFFTAVKSHLKNEFIYEKLTELFESLTDGEGSFSYKEHYLLSVANFYPMDLVTLSEKGFSSTLDISGLSIIRTYQNDFSECWDAALIDVNGKTTINNVILEKKENQTVVSIFLSDLKYLFDLPYFGKIVNLAYSFSPIEIRYVLCENAIDLSIEEKIEMLDKSEFFLKLNNK